jgi:hypothetical protein
MNIYATLNQLKFYAIDKVAYMQSEYIKLYLFLATIQSKKNSVSEIMISFNRIL